MILGHQAATGAGAQPELAEENEVLKKVIEQMKQDMETIVDKVKAAYAEDREGAPSLLGGDSAAKEPNAASKLMQ
jgi:hypothetical protein